METLRFKDCCRFIVYIFWILVLYAIEQAPGAGISIMGIRPLLVISAFVSISLFEREYTAMIFGIFCGFLIDLSFGTPLGCFAFVFCLMGYILGVLTSYFYNVNIFSFLAFDLFVLTFILFLKFCFLYLICGYDNGLYAWNMICLPTIFYSLLISPIVFFTNRFISYYIRGNEGEQNKS